MHAPRARTLFELLAEQAQLTPDRPAALTATGAISYADLHANAAKVAAKLRAIGIARGERVGLLCNNRIEWLEIAFGVAALGATLVPFSTWSTAAELDFLLTDSGVRLVFTLGTSGGRAYNQDLATLMASGRHPQLERLIEIDGPPGSANESYDAFRNGPALDAAALGPGDVASAGDPFVILYTSGSSNRPKSVPLLHYATIENGFNIGERQGLRAGDRVLISIPLFWSYGAANALPAVLSHGATIVLQTRFEPGEALDLIERHQATGIYTLPAMTSALLSHANFRPERTRSLRSGVTIGAPQDVLKAANDLGITEICNIYGSTETYGNCCVTWHHWPLDRRAQCQGEPLPGVTLRIRDGETAALKPIGEIGEVEVTGYLTKGYLGESARHNAEVLTPDGWFRTGDLGMLRADGTFVFAGRSSEMIKRSGINVSPAEVEEVLQQHADVALAGVTGVPDAIKGEIICAYVIARPGRTIAPATLIAHCREKLSGYKVPDRLELTAALPLTPTGKLMRRELKAMASQPK